MMFRDFQRFSLYRFRTFKNAGNGLGENRGDLHARQLAQCAFGRGGHTEQAANCKHTRPKGHAGAPPRKIPDRQSGIEQTL